MSLIDRIKTGGSAVRKWLTNVGGHVKSVPRNLWNATRVLVSKRGHVRLYYFEDILLTEFDVINARRAQVIVAQGGERRSRDNVAQNHRLVEDSVQDAEARGATDRIGDAGGTSMAGESARKGVRSPDPERLFGTREKRSLPQVRNSVARSEEPDRNKIRPRPVPCDATGLALSGGGIRSAAVCLGALQALHKGDRLGSIDYLSTVSGGGYIGACLSAAMSSGDKSYPFGTDIADNAALAHLRNYSNYLMPRGRSGVRNLAEAAVVLLRGLLANAAIVVAILIGCALATASAYAETAALGVGSMVPRLLDVLLGLFDIQAWSYFGNNPFGLTDRLAGLLGALLLAWAFLRAYPRLDFLTGDTSGRILSWAYGLLIATLIAAFLDLPPLAIKVVIDLHATAAASPVAAVSSGERWSQIVAALVAFSGAVAAFAGPLGRFLETTRRGGGWQILLRRALAKAAIIAAGLVLPVVLWAAYLWLSAWAIEGWPIPAWLDWRILRMWPLADGEAPVTRLFWIVLTATAAVALSLKANAYSLHRFYRDRLSKAFLFGTPMQRSADPPPLNSLKLSELKNSKGPYHLINAAMNVQGSKEANRRGRNADFFMFSSQFVGSDLTLYARTAAGAAQTDDMERIDARLDLATAMAISGAAVSANMGSHTIRVLSPTLALLNIRLGYWLRNPRDLARRTRIGWQVSKATRRVREKFYLFAEMLNLHDETSREVYLTDGGHIENLGLYELLKRGCELIVVVDAEADPNLTFASLLKVERYARIDLGVRIVLPWEEIADAARDTERRTAQGERPCRNGPHCAVGRIIYEDGALGTILYFKPSLSGDEKDYLLDYKRRNGSFPHETTSDQFFTEEQFEMYRSLGFHMVDGFFSGSDRFAFQSRWKEGFRTGQNAREEVNRLLPAEVSS